METGHFLQLFYNFTYPGWWTIRSHQTLSQYVTPRLEKLAFGPWQLVATATQLLVFTASATREIPWLPCFFPIVM